MFEEASKGRERKKERAVSFDLRRSPDRWNLLSLAVFLPPNSPILQLKYHRELHARDASPSGPEWKGKKREV